ncbi:MAG: metallophosphoesterase [Flavobacterium sp.]|uniref:metallophosphoesterase family protein n=1 Tax=Flavobacterium sp. TaxID=239 RepID=UPI00262164A5|nr:metallophosphoesterase [Flavobacterium sp.]MDD5151924.1 metallophosphoesterase [Flavobacterium sp.]
MFLEGSEYIDDMLFIGDVHGKTITYESLINNAKGCSIQVGDFGFKGEHKWHLNNVNHKYHQILFGNHDHHPFINEEHSLGKFGYIEDKGIFFVSGAFSIDQKYRIEDLDWFRNEELNYQESISCIELYEKVKPNIIVSHDCPYDIRKYFFGYDDRNPTCSLLQLLLNYHKPKFWVFGHHHKSKDEIIDGTRFVCLKELGTIEINLNEYR